MKLGLGFGTQMLTPDNLRFARQAGVTHIVAHTSGYRRENEKLPPGPPGSAGYTGEGSIWTTAELLAMRQMVNAEGLELEALENFNPAFWYDILLDGPRKLEQMENLKQLIRNVGQAGIPIFGYNFSIAGVWGRTNGPYARGGAIAPAFLAPEEPPIPNGMVWNMIYDADAPTGTVAPVSQEELWERAHFFLKEILPVAEESGVIMAAHPDDPPLPTLRGAARLVYQPRYYQNLFDLVPSPNNQAEFCVGTLAEMTEGDIYETVDRFSAMGKVAYVHLRNVRGKVPNYYEVFIDEGDTDLLRVLRILAKNNYQGVIIPDHAPQMICAAPWHAGMAFALGYIRAGITLALQS
jgi:mannonate dehydratase